MDPSNGDSLFNFCNFLNTLQLDDKNDSSFNLSNDHRSTLPVKNVTGNLSIPTLSNKDLKSLFGNDDRNDLGSTGASDKSLSSFGSESNDSSGETSNSDALLLNLNGLINMNSNINCNDHQQQNKQHAPNINHQSFRDTSSGFYPFSQNSSSSSPPSSQTSCPSSASSLSEAVDSNIVLGKNNSCNKFNNQAIGVANAFSLTTNNLHNPFCSTTAASSMPFNTLSQPIKASPFNSINKNENLFHLNPLEDALNSFLSGQNEISNNNDSLNISSVLSSNMFRSSDSGNLIEQRPTPSVLFPNTSQENLNLNTLSFTSDSSTFNNLISSRETNASIFNNNLNTLASNISKTSTTASLTSPIASSPLFSSNVPVSFNEILEQRQKNNNNNNSNSNHSSLALSPSNIQLQARFDYQFRSIANEINSTVQLYLNSIQMRKEQLLKQLDHIRNSYSLLLNQNANKNKLLSQIPKITFTRLDQNLFKSITSFGFICTPAFAPCCLVTGEGLTMAVEGEPTCFVISCRNCFNEEIPSGGESIDIEIQPYETDPQHNSFIPLSLNIQKNILDHNNGKYNATYMIPRGSGLKSVKIFVSINGLMANNSPYVATVKTERLREHWKLIAIHGEEGSDPGKFCRPWGIAITRLPLQKDPNHKLVVDVAASSTIPMNSKSFYNWTCSNSRKDYLIAVADRSNNRIQLLKMSVAENSENTSGQFLVNSANKVEISVLRKFGSGPGTRPGFFDRPAGIAINTNLGQLVVADKDNHRIQVFDLTGGFLFKFGEKGSRAGQFCYPWDVAICPQTSMILVSDTRNRRIQLFTHFGQYIWHCGQPLDSPRGVAFLSPERYIISDFNKHRLLIIDKNDSNNHQIINHRDDWITSKYIGFGEGSAWGEFLRPQGLLAVVKKNPAGVKYVQIFCADTRNNRIAIYNSLNQDFDYIYDETPKAEHLAKVSTTFDRPSGIAIADDILAVIDFGNNRLQIFQKILR